MIKTKLSICTATKWRRCRGLELVFKEIVIVFVILGILLISVNICEFLFVATNLLIVLVSSIITCLCKIRIRENKFV